MKILFLTNLLPYPLDNGGKIKTYTTLKSLKSADHLIDLVCFTEDEELSKAYEIELLNVCDSVTQIPWKLTTTLNKVYMAKVALRSIFSRYSFGLLKYVSPQLIAYLNTIGKEKVYDCIYFDHLQMCVYYDIARQLWKNAEFVLDEHNCEFLIMHRNASTSKNILKRIFLKFETRKLKSFESLNLSRFDKVIVLSNEDDSMLKAIATEEVNTVIIPIGMNVPKQTVHITNDNLDTINILFLGTLSWAPNNDGILWFIKNAIPFLKKRCIKFTLTIVGKNPGDELKNQARNFEEINLVGYVDSVFPYYEKCDCMIVPLFVGSGQRVKIIEGFSFGMPIISTSIGAEGLKSKDGENILIADDAESFAEKIELIKDGNLRKKLSINANDTFVQNYSIDAVRKLICSTVEM